MGQLLFSLKWYFIYTSIICGVYGSSFSTDRARLGWGQCYELQIVFLEGPFKNYRNVWDFSVGLSGGHFYFQILFIEFFNNFVYCL